MNEMKNLILNYITKDECNYMCDDKLFDCNHCSNVNECFSKANDCCDDEFVNSIDYGGYNTKEDFWGNLFN